MVREMVLIMVREMDRSMVREMDRSMVRTMLRRRSIQQRRVHSRRHLIIEHHSFSPLVVKNQMMTKIKKGTKRLMY